jgi:molybdate transport system regulatory protein
LVEPVVGVVMDARAEARLRVEDVEFDERDAALLRAIEREGSLNAAAESLGRSYSRAHSRVSTLEEELGALVDRQRGGARGGGSSLTDDARRLLERFDALRGALEGTARTETVELPGEVVDREGGLATIETPAGRVRALLDDDARDVRVTFRADAVTLQEPSGVPDTEATSARNRFHGTVTGVERATATATVEVDVGAADPLVVRITTDSLERLGLAVGDDVVASFKATATRATPTI